MGKGPFKMKGYSYPGTAPSMAKRNEEKKGTNTTTTEVKDDEVELNEFGETPEEYKQRMIDMGLRTSDEEDEIKSKINVKASKKDAREAAGQ